MPTADRGDPDVLVDTSAAVAVSIGDHRHHATAVEQLRDRRRGLAGHAAFETFSVLTRLPPPARRTPHAVARMLASNFPHTKFLGARAARSLLARLEADGIAGGSVYDALVGGAALEHGLPLATLDKRAVDTYRKLEVRVELLA